MEGQVLKYHFSTSSRQKLTFQVLTPRFRHDAAPHFVQIVMARANSKPIGNSGMGGLVPGEGFGREQGRNANRPQGHKGFPGEMCLSPQPSSQRASACTPEPAISA
jgi:hypothetical protein